MDNFASFMTAALIAVFTQNLVLEYAFGANVTLYASRKKSQFLWTSLGIITITTLSAAVVYPIDRLFAASKIYYLFTPIIYIVIISILYIGGLLLLWRFKQRTFVKIRKYAHLAAFNCAVLGALFINSVQSRSFWEYTGFGFGTGVGFLLACALLYGARERLYSEKIPAAFRGFPIIMVYMGIVSMTFFAIGDFVSA